jgi:DNA-directed RNA polymerase specialized sigma24 family protein
MTQLSIEEKSVTRWVQAVRAKDETAAEELWKRYFERLMQVARSRMSYLPRSTYDEEDAAISTFRVLYSKLQTGSYTQLGSRDELWHLMLKVLMRKIGHRAEYELADKRVPPGPRADAIELENLFSQEVTGEMAVGCKELLSKLRDTNLEQIAVWKLEGMTNEEIATKLNRTRRTVQRMLELIRAIWQEEDR